MKKLVLIFATFLVFSMNSFAQNNIELRINHQLGDADFAMETSAKNNLDNDFKVTRLQYYISEIIIVHDGGTETMFNENWVLAEASKTTIVDLGNRDINSVEMVKIHVGVDSSHNHLDPASYPMLHPLAPKNPSMHWGWASGYRFVALEGSSGSNFGQQFQFHGLGDINYFTTEIPLTTEAVNNQVIIDIDADYTRAVEDIDLSSGVIVHGDYGVAKQCLENFRDYVFTAASETTSTIDFSEVKKFDVFPNPANSQATLVLEAKQDLTYQVSVTNILGKQLMFFDAVNSHSRIDISLTDAGFYFINLIKEGQIVATQKLISK